MSETGGKQAVFDMTIPNQVARDVEVITRPAMEAYWRECVRLDRILADEVDRTDRRSPWRMDCVVAWRAAHRRAFEKYLAALEALKQGG